MRNIIFEKLFILSAFMNLYVCLVVTIEKNHLNQLKCGTNIYRIHGFNCLVFDVQSKKKKRNIPINSIQFIVEK